MQLEELFEFLPSALSHHQYLAAKAKLLLYYCIHLKEMSFQGTE